MLKMHTNHTRMRDETAQQSAKLDLLLHRILHAKQERSTSAAGLFPFNGTLLFKVIFISLVDMLRTKELTFIPLTVGVWHSHISHDPAAISAVGNEPIQSPVTPKGVTSSIQLNIPVIVFLP